MDFPVMIKSILCKWCRKLGFCYEQHDEKMQVYQHFDVDIVPSTCSFITNETQAQVFSREF